MKLPYLNELTKKQTSTVFTQAFKGYNHNLRSETGEFYLMKNMTTDHYPVLTTRTGEDEQHTFSGNPNGIFEYEENKLMVVAGKNLYVKVTDGLGEMQMITTLTDSEKYFAQIGTKTVIMPDKVIYDAKTNTASKIEKTFRTVTETVGNETQRAVIQKESCDIYGQTYSPESSNTAPSDTTKYWYDTTSDLLKKYSEASQTWVVVDSPYMRLLPAISTTTPDYTNPQQTIDADVAAQRNALSTFFGTLEVMDTVSIAFSSAEGAETTDYVVFGKGSVTGQTGLVRNYIVVVGYPSQEVNNYTVKNKCPDLTHICALNNRVWGVDNNTHTIHACKLGDPTQWYNYPGLAADSYYVALPTRDEVTGCASYSNIVHFFTEDKVMKIYGDYPSNYQLAEYKMDGVIKGGHKTVVPVEGVLYYVSPVGVMAYDGSFPSIISNKLAPHFLYGKILVAGRDQTKYCLSVSINDEPFGVFMYDTQSGLWVIGSDQMFRYTSQYKNSLTFLNINCKWVTVYDREKYFDWIGLAGDPLLNIDREIITLA